MKTLKFRFFSVSAKIIIVYASIIAVFIAAFLTNYYFSKREIDDKLTKVNEEYFTNKVSYIESTFKYIKNNAYELRNYMDGKKSAAADLNDPLEKYDEISRLSRLISYYNYLDDVFIYSAKDEHFISALGTMDIDVYFRMSYYDENLTERWKQMAHGDRDVVVNVTKYPEYELSSRKDFFKRLLYVDIDYLKSSDFVIGFIIDIEKVIRNENNQNSDINNFFVIKNDSPGNIGQKLADAGSNGSDALKSFLYNTLEFDASGMSFQTDESVGILKIKNNYIYYQYNNAKELIYLNVVNMDKYYDRLGYFNMLPVILTALLLVLVIVVSSSFLSRFSRNLNSIRSFIEDDFVKSVIEKQQSGENQQDAGLMQDVKAFIGLSGIKQIAVMMLCSRLNSIDSRDEAAYCKAFNKFLSSSGISFKSFNFTPQKTIFIVDARSIKNFTAFGKSVQKQLERLTGAELPESGGKVLTGGGNEGGGSNMGGGSVGSRGDIGSWSNVLTGDGNEGRGSSGCDGANSEKIIFISGIYGGQDGIEKAINEVLYLSEKLPVKVKNKVIHLENISSDDYFNLPDEFRNIFRNSLACGERQNAVLAISNLINDNVENGISSKSFSSLISKINNIVLETIFEKYIEDYNTAVQAVGEISSLSQHAGAGLIIYLYEELISGISINAPAAGESKSRNKLLQCFASYIEENYNRDIYLESMAEHFNLSPKYVSSKFKETTGENFTDYLKHYRIKVAKELLRNTGEKINVISEKVGYNNVNVFIRHFKSVEGITPKTYREVQ